MSTVHLATSEAESTAVVRLIEEQTERIGALTVLTETLLSAVEDSDGPRSTTARTELVQWGRTQLVPHLVARDAALHPVAHRHDRLRQLTEAQRANVQTLTRLLDALESAPNPVRAVGHARGLEVLLSAYARAEHEQILPLLVQTPGVSLDTLANVMAEHAATTSAALGGTEDAGTSPETGTCGCGGHDEPGLPVLDARAVPHAIRHATIFGALDAVGPRSGLILLAPHDPLPLLAQIDARWPGVFAVDYLERGPETWKLSFTR